MALTWQRWVTAALLGAALLAVALLPPSPDYWETAIRPAAPRYSRLAELDGLINAERRRLVLERQRGDLRAQLRHEPRPSGAQPRLSVSGPVPPRLVTTIQAGWDSALVELGPFDTASSAWLILQLIDSARFQRRPVLYFLPEATDGSTCVAVVQVDRSQRLWAGTAPRAYALRALGPCAYYAAFGNPGSGVRALLTRSHLFPAYTPDWAGPARSRTGPIVTDWDFLPYSTPQRLISLFVARPFLESFAATACAAGQLEQCQRALESADGFVPGSWREVRMPGGVAVQRGWLQPWWDRDMAHFFADLIRDQGRESFQRFWQSPLPADSAFADAFGVSTPEWTRRWLRQGRDLRYGPAIRSSSVLLSLLLTVALVGAAAGWTMRRQVS